MRPEWVGGSQEISRRRLLLLAISGLTVFATLPVLGHHLLGGGGNLLNGRDNIGNLCLVALHALLAPVHFGFHLALFIGVTYAVADRARAWSRLNRVIGRFRFETLPPFGPFSLAFAAADVQQHDVVIVNGLPNPAFTAGWWKPRIYLAAELSEVLDDAELMALITHERAHLERRDPLRLAVLRFFACTVFWLPALRRLADDVADEAEFEADATAARGNPLVLASAILKIALRGRGMPRMRAAIGFAAPDLVEQRVRRLSGEYVPNKSHVTTRSLTAAAIMLAVALASGVVMAHPVSAAEAGSVDNSSSPGTHSSHKGKCSQHQGLALLHLFCEGLPFGLAAVDCPHHTVTATL